MNAEDLQLRSALETSLIDYSAEVRALPGIQDPQAMNAFLFQLVESLRRIRFVRQLSNRPISAFRADPMSEIFDPVRAAAYRFGAGEIDEACWLVFLFTHFGKNRLSGYRLIQDIYGRLGLGSRWDWNTVAQDPLAFRLWLEQAVNIMAADSIRRGFGNHRKYQSLNAWGEDGTGAAVESYIAWVSQNGGHATLFTNAVSAASGNAEVAFRGLYESMTAVRTFGRTARFDYLTMIGKLAIAPISPDSVYFQGATGPVTGARLLFYGVLNGPGSARQLQTLSNELATRIGLDKQAMEDSLCNWQKSPTQKRRFRG